MAVEIKELIIRATVANDPQEDSGEAGKIDAEAKEAIIKTCVEQVLMILERSKER